MRSLSRALIVIALIFVVGAGVYYLIEERNKGPFEEAGEKMDQAIEDLGDEIERN